MGHDFATDHSLKRLFKAQKGTSRTFVPFVGSVAYHTNLTREWTRSKFSHEVHDGPILRERIFCVSVWSMGIEAAVARFG